MTRKEMLEKTISIVCEDGEQQYGKPEDNFNEIAKLWSIYLGYPISAKDVAIMMALLKIARIKSGMHKDDNYIDLAGYAACACECAPREE